MVKQDRLVSQDASFPWRRYMFPRAWATLLQELSHRFAEKKLCYPGLLMFCWQATKKWGRDNILVTKMFPDCLRNSALNCKGMAFSLNSFSPRKRRQSRKELSFLPPFIKNITSMQWLKLQSICSSGYSGNSGKLFSSLQRRKKCMGGAEAD